MRLHLLRCYFLIPPWLPPKSWLPCAQPWDSSPGKLFTWDGHPGCQKPRCTGSLACSPWHHHVFVRSLRTLWRISQCGRDPWLSLNIPVSFSYQNKCLRGCMAALIQDHISQPPLHGHVMKSWPMGCQWEVSVNNFQDLFWRQLVCTLYLFFFIIIFFLLEHKCHLDYEGKSHTAGMAVWWPWILLSLWHSGVIYWPLICLSRLLDKKNK